MCTSMTQYLVLVNLICLCLPHLLIVVLQLSSDLIHPQLHGVCCFPNQPQKNQSVPIFKAEQLYSHSGAVTSPGKQSILLIASQAVMGIWHIKKQT